MRLSDLVLTCVFILTCTGMTRRSCLRLRISEGALAAACLILLALSNLRVPIGVSASVDPALYVVAGWSLFICRKEGRLWQAALLALVCAAIARVLENALPNALEPGLLLALPSAFVAWLFVREPRRALLVTLLAPLFTALLVAGENAYSFGSVLLSGGDPVRFDTQAFGALLLGVLGRSPLLNRMGDQRKRLADEVATTAMQKDT